MAFGLFGKRAQMMHQASGMDLVIILIGVILGIVLVWYGLSNGWLPSSMFCPTPAAPVY